ncbi:DUF1861 family protein [Culicoidibacter larvae]|uniref:DUF1861 family protein n=1 Tax=Culicoidibacter larvae TaxID=2579976 RepID=A0A5R8QAJ6_9FIRM|nr:DUF1861 family protein [Culicoidibacter larvae]TLG72936.1 DUF1861 family protein [Culicoidibacter larvae]
MIKTCLELRDEYRKNNFSITADKLQFIGVDGFDVYNISKPFIDGGRQLLAGRVEPRDSEDSTVRFFEVNDTVCTLVSDAPEFRLQDPFVHVVRDQLILGGVEIFEHPQQPGALWWRTVVYGGASLADLKPLFVGPNGMKDIRFVDLGARIGVFTRPQGEYGGRGQIGFVTITDWHELSADLVAQAPLIDGLFVADEWGGVNDAHFLGDTSIAVLGHCACFGEQGERHYYPFTFVFDFTTMTVSNVKMIFERSDLPAGASKRPDLIDVVFPGGMHLFDGVMQVYCGLSDAEAGRVIISDPFVKGRLTNEQ